ncbi:hypothetical protein GCM10007425_19070 [Lysinibacillus alkalisoli]|uniref:YufK family protein n=1 Tax=Lysinibacillus alkalisoli TaxID=1911548 RepID=A0A917G6S3_9BACI|nr:DUF5366 family protein [Lysinibacillus alkalisoli]GGG24684.1 hypothetical protein GCM10007425_19070 [Lysinibacillus alkalisoli]
MKNPYFFGFLPLVTILFFSMSFGIFAVNESLLLFKKIGIYAAMREFLTDFELRTFLFICFIVLFFMLFAAIKLIGETVHAIGMLFFAKFTEEQPFIDTRSSYVVLFIGACVSFIGMNHLFLLLSVSAITIIAYFIVVMARLTTNLSFFNVLLLLLFEFVIYTVIILGIAYAVVKLYNTLLASLPF